MKTETLPAAWMGYAPPSEGRTCVSICSYCPDTAQANALAKSENLAATHGICVKCYQKQMAEILGES